MSKHHLIIAGGGIGGLTAALALARTGHRVTVLEQAAALAEVGAGIQLSPNASRVLVDLGLRDALDVHAITPRDIVVHSSRSGGEVARTPVGRSVEARYGAPFWVIHRADLQERVFAMMGIDHDEARDKFGFLLDAFAFGAPPHGGIAFGFDRWTAIMGGSDTIRDYIAFPKNNQAREVMIDTPSSIKQEQLDELGIVIKKEEKKG